MSEMLAEGGERRQGEGTKRNRTTGRLGGERRGERNWKLMSGEIIKKEEQRGGGGKGGGGQTYL